MSLGSPIGGRKRMFVLYTVMTVLRQARIERPMSKVTEEHVEARRRQILSAALRCFAQQGFHRTTMQDIFREADLSPGAVYSYFAGKDELVRSIVGAMMSFLAESAPLFNEPLPEGRPRRPGEALAELIERYREFELGTVVERARIFPHLVGEQQRDQIGRA